MPSTVYSLTDPDTYNRVDMFVEFSGIYILINYQYNNGPLLRFDQSIEDTVVPVSKYLAQAARTIMIQNQGKKKLVFMDL